MSKQSIYNFFVQLILHVRLSTKIRHQSVFIENTKVTINNVIKSIDFKSKIRIINGTKFVENGN